MRAALVIAGLLTLASAPAMAQAAGQTIKVAGWDIRRIAGQVPTCVAAQTAGDNTALAFGATANNQTFVMLIDPTGKFTPGQDYGLEYHVDTGKLYKTTAKASAPTTMLQVVGSFADAAPLFTAVEEGDSFHLATNGATYEFPLDGSKAAMGALEACVKAAM